MSVRVEADVALGVRRALSTLRGAGEAAREALAAVRGAATAEARQRAAMDAALRCPGLALAGELVSRAGEDREALILAATDTDEERAHARALAESLSERGVFRALRGVFPYSYRSPTLEAWERYRAHLKGLMDQPAWPGRDVTLRQLYVPPACVETHRWSEGLDEGGAQALAERGYRSTGATHEDPLPVLLAMLDDEAKRPLVIEGQSGLGKSTVAMVLAEALAAREDQFPILVSTSGFAANSTLWQNVLLALTAEGYGDLLGDHPWVDPPTVLIELADFREGLALPLEALALMSAGKIRGAVLVRTTQAPSLLGVELLPFDDDRAREWTRRWNVATGSRFDVEPFLQQPPDNEDDGDGEGFFLPRQPLTLLMLAEMAAEGHPLSGTVAWSDRAQVYREIISWRCAQAPPAVGAQRRRGELRTAARMAHAHGAGLKVHEGNRYCPWLAWAEFSQSAAQTFPLVRGGDGFRFFHDSFAEYLLAESLALGCARLMATAPDVGDLDLPARDDLDTAAEWLRMFGDFDLTRGVTRFLDVMVPTWSRFVRGGRKAPPGFHPAWRSRVTVVYSVLAREWSFAAALRRSGIDTDDAQALRARASFALLNLATFETASIEDRFRPEDALAGAFPAIASLVTSHRFETSLFHQRISLRGAQWSETALQGVTLAYLDLTASDLSGAHLEGADLIWCKLARADLRGAKLQGAQLDRATLDGADLRGAVLDGASLVGASLKGAKLAGASLRGVVLSDAQRAEADVSDESDPTPDGRGP